MNFETLSMLMCSRLKVRMTPSCLFNILAARGEFQSGLLWMVLTHNCQNIFEIGGQQWGIMVQQIRRRFKWQWNRSNLLGRIQICLPSSALSYLSSIHIKLLLNNLHHCSYQPKRKAAYLHHQIQNVNKVHPIKVDHQRQLARQSAISMTQGQLILKFVFPSKVESKLFYR